MLRSISLVFRMELLETTNSQQLLTTHFMRFLLFRLTLYTSSQKRHYYTPLAFPIQLYNTGTSLSLSPC